MKEYYIPVQCSCETVALGLYESEEAAQNAYLKYLEESAKTPEKFNEKFEKLKFDYQAEFNEELDSLEQLRPIIFVDTEHLTNEECEKLEERHDWLMDHGIGCDVMWCKGGTLLEFGNYNGWENIMELYEMCYGILKFQGYDDRQPYMSYQYPNLYFRDYYCSKESSNNKNVCRI